MPAKYGIDPTGVGGVLGLTEMGDIKQQLYAEAAADDAAAAAAAVVRSPAAPAAGTDPAVLARLSAIETQLAAIADVIGAAPSEPSTVGAIPAPAAVEEVATPEPAAPPPVEVAADPEITEAPVPAAIAWRDTVDYTLQPGEGIEIKFVMQDAEVATFGLTANGGVLNYETHAEGSGQKISYETGRATPDQSGTLTAAFTGNHGWFWRNRSDAPVTLTLRTAGDYAEIKAP